MKKLFYSTLALALVIGLTVSGCKKSSSTDNGNSNNNTPTVPSTFTQKAVLEEFTGEWCGYCPDGALIMDDAKASYPGKVVGIAIHDNDPYALSEDQNYYIPTFGVTGFPTGMVNRVASGGSVCLNRGTWKSTITSQLAKTATCGLKIEYANFDGTNADVKVSVAFNQDYSTPLYLTVAMVEDSVAASASGQHNYYSSAGGAAGGASHPLYNKPATITGKNWYHMSVLRSFSGAGKVEGELMDSSMTKAGKVFSSTYTFSTANRVGKNCRIVAYVHPKGSASNKAILNAQQAMFGTNQSWD